MNPERVTITVDGGIADVRLTRAAKHNALDWEMFQSLDEAAAELRERGDVRAAVLSAEGPSFCAGLDFPSFMAEGRDIATAMFEHRDGDRANLAQRVTYDWQRLPMPVIAALHGHCIGGGAQLALGPDMRIAAPDTSIAILEIKYGLIPDMGITQTLPTLVGLDVAKELVFTGRSVDAEEALRIGLVTRITDDPRVLGAGGGASARAPRLAQPGRGRDRGPLRRARRVQRSGVAGSAWGAGLPRIGACLPAAPSPCSTSVASGSASTTRGSSSCSS
jgi:enoyl-CoA hydratase/carnithine racemase